MGKTPKFAAQHYNIIAAQFRLAFEAYLALDNKKERVTRISAIVDLALAMAKRFREDNPRFNPHKFLDACSGDVDLYPLSELWESYNA